MTATYDSSRTGAQKVAMQAQPDLSNVPALTNVLGSLGLSASDVQLSISPTTGASLGISRSYQLVLGDPFTSEPVWEQTPTSAPLHTVDQSTQLTSSKHTPKRPWLPAGCRHGDTAGTERGLLRVGRPLHACTLAGGPCCSPCCPLAPQEPAPSTTGASRFTTTPPAPDYPPPPPSCPPPQVLPLCPFS